MRIKLPFFWAAVAFSLLLLLLLLLLLILDSSCFLLLSPLLDDVSLELLVDWLVEFENDEDEEALEPNDLADSWVDVVVVVVIVVFEFSSEFILFDFEVELFTLLLVDWSELSFSVGGALFLQLSSVMARE